METPQHDSEEKEVWAIFITNLAYKGIFDEGIFKIRANLWPHLIGNHPQET